MSAIKTLADAAFGDYVTPGVPSSGARQVPKAEVRKAFALIDALNRKGVKSATTTAQPASPSEGDAYILPASQTGAAWSTMTSGSIAVFVSTGWIEVPAAEGFNVWVDDADQRLRHDGSAWALGSAGESIHASVTDVVFGRATAGAGPAEEIAFTAAARALCDDTSATAQRATLDAAALTVANTFTANQNIQGDVARSLTMTVGANAANASFLGRRARNTLASPQSVQSGDTLFSFTASAHDGTTYQTAGGIAWYADATWSSTQTSGARLTTVINGTFGIRLSVNGSGHVVPGADNTQNCGGASARWAVVYAGTGSINTSDAREKTAFTAIPDGVKRAVRTIIGGIGVYQWLASVAEKGADNARLHVGVTAQAVAAAFHAEGVDPNRWALFCADEIFEEVEVEEEVETLVPLEQDVWAYELVQDEESAKLSPVVTKEAVLERVPLLDAAGEPVLRDGEAVVVERPKYERRTVLEKRIVSRPVLDESGAPLVRLGVRYDQLGMLALAVYADALNAAAP